MRLQLILALGISCIDQGTAKNKDWFHHLLNTRTNWTADPCENFYRFVCPRQEESASNNEDWIDYLSQGLGKMVALDEASSLYPIDMWIDAQCPDETSKCQTETIKKLYGLLGESMDAKKFSQSDMMKDLPVTIQTKTERILPMAIMSFWRSEFVKDLNVSIDNAYENANLMMQSIQRQVRKMLTNTSYTKNDNIEKRRLKINMAKFEKSVFNFTQIIKDEHAELFGKMIAESINKGKEVLNENGLGKEPKENNFWSTLISMAPTGSTSISKHERSFVKLLETASSFNARNSRGTIFDQVYIGGHLLRKALNVKKYPLTYAMLAQVFGHEVFHSYFRDADSNSMSPETLKRADCIIRNAEETCQILGEESCHSGKATIKEDGPDLEGVRAAYLQYRHKFASKFKDQVYKDVQGMNYEQAYFFANAGLWCQKYSVREQHRSFSNENHTIFDVHSGVHIRPQMVFRQMPQFAKAFNCPAESPMRAKEICHVFGDELFMDE